MIGFKRALASCVAVLAMAASVAAQEALESFYRGKTVTMVIGSSAGGGYDAYARLVGRHIGKYIPGKPNIIPSNMNGAGGNTASNYVFSIAVRDGTVIGASSPGSLLDPLLSAEKNSLKHEPLKFNYIGSANGEFFTCIVRNDAGLESFAEAFEKEVIIGVSGGTTHDMPRALVNVLGARLKLVAGYPGTREVMLAMDKNEVQGICGQGIANISWQRPDWFQSGSPVRVLVQESIHGDPELNRLGVPMALSFAKTPEQKQVLEIVYAQGLFTRPYFMAPDVPRDRVDAMRNAFAQMLMDREFLVEADKQKLIISPMSGVELESIIRKIYATPLPVIEKVRSAVLPQ